MAVSFGKLRDIMKISTTVQLPPNKFPRIKAAEKIRRMDGTVEVVLDSVESYDGGGQAIVHLSAKEVFTLLSSVTHVLASDIDPASSIIPSAGQRSPTNDRAKKIEDGWSNDQMINDYACEVWHVRLFGGEIIRRGNDYVLKLKAESPNSGFAIDDGGGRCRALYAQIGMHDAKSIDGADVVKRGIRFNYIIDLDPSALRGLRTFRKLGEHIKKIPASTQLQVRVAELRDTGRMPKIDDPEATVYILDQLYKRPKDDSLIRYFPWNADGDKCDITAAGFVDISKPRSAFTTLHVALSSKTGFNVRRLLNDIGDTKACINAIDFILRQWNRMCRPALEARVNGDAKVHLLTQLGLKVIFTIGLKAYMLSEADPKGFEETCCDILTRHFKLYAEEYHTTKGPKKRKMTPNDFWFQCQMFYSDGFTSAAVNDYICKQLARAANQVLGIEDPSTEG